MLSSLDGRYVVVVRQAGGETKFLQLIYSTQYGIKIWLLQIHAILKHI